MGYLSPFGISEIGSENGGVMFYICDTGKDVEF